MIDEKTLKNTIDATIWAKAFMEVIKGKPKKFIDEAFMLGWFANAIETTKDIMYHEKFSGERKKWGLEE